MAGGATGTGGTTGAGGSAASGGAIQTGGVVDAGGRIGNGGAPGTGGATAKGGTTGTGGVGMGGTMAKGGTTGTDGAIASGGGGVLGTGGTTVVCTITPTASTSTKIATVGIVTWTTSLADVKAARIDFGLTTDYGMSAPVDITANDYRTLLLGMKPQKTYHYRIVASSNVGDCTSDDYTISAGSLLAGLPKVTVTTTSTASPPFGGFLVMGVYAQMGGTEPVYILDADGAVVWAYGTKTDVTSARMNHAGTHIWFSNANMPGGTAANVRRVAMDGLAETDLSDKFAGMELQLAILPDDTVAFFAAGASGCHDIKEYSPTGSVTTIANAGAAQGVTGDCRLMSIQHSKDDDTLVFSDLAHQSIVKVRRGDGAAVWVLNGSTATFTGYAWQGGQSGLHVLAADRLLLFANNSPECVVGSGRFNLGGTGDGSSAIELGLDLIGKKVSQIWSYKTSIQNPTMGDVQRLPNGNTIVAYSVKGVLHEVDASGALVQEWTWPGGANFGYVEKRATLYGPPQR